MSLQFSVRVAEYIGIGRYWGGGQGLEFLGLLGGGGANF